jgi:ferric-dicitrate binding protein FerR (iron transport regulator)
LSRRSASISEQFRLFEAALSSSATEEQLRSLESLLLEDDEALDRYVEFTQQDVELRHAFRIGLVNDAPRPSALTPAELPSHRKSAGREVWSRSRTLAVLAGGLAVCVAIAVRPLLKSDVAPTLAHSSPVEIAPAMFADVPPAPVATLTMHRGARWEGRQLTDGQSLSEGDRIHLVAGEARISMGFGAEITTKAPCQLEFVAADRVMLEIGEVAVHVADWARGFTVETSAMEVVDLGTTFTVSASPDASAETNVIKGQVRVSPRQTSQDGLRSVLVSEGENLRVDLHGRRRAGEMAPLDLTRWGEWATQTPYRPIVVHNTGHDIDVGDEDPHWRVIGGPADSFSGSQFAMVCVPDVRYLPNERETSQWVSMANWRNATPNSVFTFQTTFDLTGFDLQTIQLFGRFLADNGIREVRVNGKPAALESWSDNKAGQEFQHPQFRTVNVTKGLINGTNVIEVDVWNGTFVQTTTPTPNPMALRVEWQAFGRMTSSELDVTAGRPPASQRREDPRRLVSFGSLLSQG